jgi:hypothetical protein
MRRSHVQPGRALLFALVALSAAAVVPASALADGLTPSLPATPTVATPAVATPSVPASVPAVSAPSVSATVTANAASTSASVTASTRSGVSASVSTQASTGDRASARPSKQAKHSVRGKRHSRAHHRARGNASPTRSLSAMLNCPLPGPKEAVHCTNFPTGGEFPDKCNNSMVTVAGTIQYIETVTVNPDFTITMTKRENFQNVTGVGVPDGAEYQANDKDVTETSTIPLSTTLSVAYDQKLELITIQPAWMPNQILHLHEDLTIDINPLDGTPTITGQPDEPDFMCTG